LLKVVLFIQLTIGSIYVAENDWLMTC
jgi:hypothetical protein